jgi:hypothetical protein
MAHAETFSRMDPALRDPALVEWQRSENPKPRAIRFGPTVGGPGTSENKTFKNQMSRKPPLAPHNFQRKDIVAIGREKVTHRARKLVRIVACL